MGKYMYIPTTYLEVSMFNSPNKPEKCNSVRSPYSPLFGILVACDIILSEEMFLIKTIKQISPVSFYTGRVFSIFKLGEFLSRLR